MEIESLLIDLDKEYGEDVPVERLPEITLGEIVEQVAKSHTG